MPRDEKDTRSNLPSVQVNLLRGINEMDLGNS